MAMLDFTLAADEQIVRQARQYAAQHDTTLDQMIHDYVERVANEAARDSDFTGLSPEDAAARFERNARQNPGRSSPGWKFSRESLYRERMGA